VLRVTTVQSGELSSAALSTYLFYQQVQAMELMLNDGWLRAKHAPKLPLLSL
jgi:hypothetical protein